MMKLMEELFGRTEPVRVALLGSTGSIGRQALDVVRANPDQFKVVALAAATDAQGLAAQAAEFQVSLVGIEHGPIEVPESASLIEGKLAAAKVAEETDAEVILNAVVGAAGLHATMATILSGKTLALANKESLVAAGEFVMGKAQAGQIRPVDSEHSALWQILEQLPPHVVRKIVITGSGGPFRGRRRQELTGVSVEEALAHPVWQMGRKITIDSATLMNKGLEVIEAHFLFGFTYDEIDVVIHPQGLIHALVEATDGAVFAHAAPPDMRLPIQIALGWPERLSPPGGKRIDLATAWEATFEPPDTETFRCLGLAYEAGRSGDTFPAVLNAANEVAVEAFLAQRIGFLTIPEIVQSVMEEHSPAEASLESVLEQDFWARARAAEIISGSSAGEGS